MLLLKVCVCVCADTRAPACVCIYCVFRGGWARHSLLVQFSFWCNRSAPSPGQRFCLLPIMQLAGWPSAFASVCHRRRMISIKHDCLRRRQHMQRPPPPPTPHVTHAHMHTKLLSIVLSSKAEGFFKLVFCFGNGC